MANQQGQPVIAIDGTSASGKSTLSARLAEEAGAERLEYSLMFRAIAEHMVREHGFVPNLDASGNVIASSADEVANAVAYAQRISEMGWDEFKANIKDNPNLRNIEVSKATPYFAGRRDVIHVVDPAFAAIIDASPKPVVAEGRTIGRYTYPQADVKLFITATLYQRAVRRNDGLREKGKIEPLEDTICDLARRDHQDQTRNYQPTMFDPETHHLINNTLQTPEETLKEAKEHINEVLGITLVNAY